MVTNPIHSRAGSGRADCTRSSHSLLRRLPSSLAALGLGASLLLSTGCEVDSWFDPSRTGYFEHTPTSIPILRRIDVIEVESEPFATEVGAPKREDLVFGNVDYEFGYGDVVEIQINDLFQDAKTEGFRRTVDQAGRILLPVVGSVDMAGLTKGEVVKEISDRLRTIIPNPEVDVEVTEARNYTFTVIGDVRNPGVYTLSRPDFDVVDAVALAGGADQGTKRLRIVRVIPDESLLNEKPITPSGPTDTARPVPPTTNPATKPPETEVPAASIDDLINQITPAQPVTPPPAPAPAPAPVPAPTPAPTPPPSSDPGPATPPAVDPATPPSTDPATPPAAPPSTPPLEPPPPPSAVSYTPPKIPAAGVVRAPVVVDIEPLQAPTTQEQTVLAPNGAVKLPPGSVRSDEDQYVFDVQKQEWILVPAAEAQRMESAHLTEPNSPDGAVTGSAAGTAMAAPLKLASDFRLPSGQKTRIIEIDWSRIKSGDWMLKAIIRPDDKVFVEVEAGVVYIDGEVARPGVYSLPAIGDLTLSRLVSAAGGLGQIAIPQRVDLIRKIAPDREAAIRVNLAAIRNRAEPDIQLRADDHVIIGTNFIATPLAVIRNGFRMTYGFGFLLDRNFGNDVFGAPPTNIVGN